MAPSFLQARLDKLEASLRLRSLSTPKPQDIDLCSNDYLGVLKDSLFDFPKAHLFAKGASGSRLISGHQVLYDTTEALIAHTHEAEAALLFNSGYDANLGLFTCLAGRGDTVIFDSHIHASIRDGIRLSFAFSLQFRHNDMRSLEKRLQQAQGQVFVAVEGVYSMNGDTPPLSEIVGLCKRYKAYLIVDEAHSFGIVGAHGEGLCVSTKVHADCLARIYTYGKALGLHGACVVGSKVLKQYLINNARSFIFTTALPPVSVYYLSEAYQQLGRLTERRLLVKELIDFFKKKFVAFSPLASQTPIQSILYGARLEVLLDTAGRLKEEGFFVSPIRYPTVAQGEERIRICLHSFNTKQDLEALARALPRKVS